MKKIFAILLFFLSANVASSDVGLSPQEKYELGLRYLKRGNFTKALEQFNHIRNFYRDDPLAIDSELAIADLYFQKAEWDQARVYYDEFKRRYPSDERLDYVTYRLGLTYYKKAPKTPERDQRWTERAVSNWKNFAIKYPSSEHKDEVSKKYIECRNRLAEKEIRIAKFYQNRSAWEGTKRRTDHLIKNFYDSKYVSQALEINAIANYHLGNSDLYQQSLEQLEKVSPQRIEAVKSTIEKAMQNKSNE